MQAYRNRPADLIPFDQASVTQDVQVLHHGWKLDGKRSGKLAHGNRVFPLQPRKDRATGGVGKRRESFVQPGVAKVSHMVNYMWAQTLMQLTQRFHSSFLSEGFPNTGGWCAVRKLILQMQVSVDGYVGRKADGPDWQVWNWGPDCPRDAPLKGRFRDIDSLLLSRKILEGGYLDHWSQFARDFADNPDFAFAQRIVDARKLVFSENLKQTKWPGTELARRPLIEEIDAHCRPAKTSRHSAEPGLLRLWSPTTWSMNISSM